MTLYPDVRRAAGFLPRLRLRRLMDRLVRADRRHRQMRSLERLDDHLLHDIGVTPADVRRELSRSIWS